MRTRPALALAALSLAACRQPQPAPKAPTAEEQALLSVKGYISQNLDELVAASAALQAAAPEPDADGWSASANPAAVEAMKVQWKRARRAYEHVEGAIAVLFPELDLSTDERYDGFLADLGPDADLFDDQGVTGVHAIERILWSDAIPAPVVAFEQALPGYQAAAFPSSAAQADAFKHKLCARLLADVTTMRDQFKPLALDTSAAYRGVIGSMREQVEKLRKAESGEEESRYAQFTLADMRANVEAGRSIYGFFRPWLLERGGTHQDDQIQADFARVEAAYAALTGDALPPKPASWSAQQPSAADLETPFGKLYQVLVREADPELTGSLVADMTDSAQVMGIPSLPE